MNGTELIGAGYFVIAIAIAIFITVFAMALAAWLLPSKSYRYRKFLTDMYVAARVRQLADEDKISLDEENRKFLVFERKIRIQEKELDRAIEEDLKDRVGKSQEEKEPKK